MGPGDWLLTGGCVLLGYLAGSIPFGLLVGRLKGVDIRTQGSGNIGATNAGRVLGKPYGVLVFLLDLLKGLLPVLLAGALLRNRLAGSGPAEAHLLWVLVAAACIAGHMFPVFLGFRGGKGVATSLGALLGIFPYFTWPGLAAFGVWVVITFATRYVSAGSVAAAAAFPIIFALWAACGGWGGADRLWPLYGFAVLLASLVIYRHRGNLYRLLQGTEPKIGTSGGNRI